VVQLRAPQERDLAVLGSIRRDPELQRRLLARARPHTDDEVRAWIERSTAAVDRAFFVIADGADSCCGFVTLQRIDVAHGRAELGICLAWEAQGRGLGRRAVDQICEHARNELGLRTVILYVLADNEAAIRSYRAAGFAEVGTLLQWFTDDAGAHDVVVMQRLL
jgi:RimJ/RimL family protein N-acetyltransferase